MYQRFNYKALTGALLLFTCSAAVSAQNPQASDAAAREVEAALELTPNLENGRRVYMICTVCHRPEGWGTEDGRYPQIAGQLRSVTIKQLADIRARNRDNPTMRPFTAPRLLGGPQEIMDVAAYIERLPMNPRNSRGSGADLAYGKELYEKNCADCHGANGEGDEKEHIPKIHGQNISYLLRQFEWIRIGKRRNADQKMVKQIRGFTPRDEMAVLDYVAHLKPPADKLAAHGWQNPDFPKYSRGPMGEPMGFGTPPQPPEPLPRPIFRPLPER